MKIRLIVFGIFNNISYINKCTISKFIYQMRYNLQKYNLVILIDLMNITNHQDIPKTKIIIKTHRILFLTKVIKLKRIKIAKKIIKKIVKVIINIMIQ